MARCASGWVLLRRQAAMRRDARARESGTLMHDAATLSLILSKFVLARRFFSSIRAVWTRSRDACGT